MGPNVSNAVLSSSYETIRGVEEEIEKEGEIGVGIEMEELDACDVAGEGGQSNDCFRVDEGVVVGVNVNVTRSWVSPSSSGGHSCPIN